MSVLVENDEKFGDKVPLNNDFVVILLSSLVNSFMWNSRV